MTEVTKKGLERHLDRGDEGLLGHVVWADVVLAGHSIDRREVRAALAKAGLWEDIQGESKSAEWAFGRAVSHWSGVGSTHHEMRREVKRSSSVLLLRYTGAGLAVAVTASAVIEASSSDPRGFRVLSQATAGDAEVEADLKRFAALVARYQHFIDAAEFQQTIRAALLRWFGGTQIRSPGTTYWVPVGSTGYLRALDSVVEAVGGSTMTSLPVYVEAAGTMGRTLADAFGGELTSLMQDMRDLASKDGATREKTWEARLLSLSDIRARYTVLRGVLDDRATELDALATTCEQRARMAMGGDVAWATLDDTAPTAGDVAPTDDAFAL